MNNEKREGNDWKDKDCARVLAIAGPFKGEIFNGWFEPENKIFHPQKKNWCHNKGAFKINCLDCGLCPKISDVEVVSEEDDAENEKFAQFVHYSSIKLLEHLCKMGFRREYKILMRISLKKANPFYGAIYRKDGKIRLLGRDKEGVWGHKKGQFFTKDLELNFKFKNCDTPVISGFDLLWSHCLKSTLTRQILIGLIKEWSRLIQPSLKVLQESG